MAAAVEKPINPLDIVDTLLFVRSFTALIELPRNIAAQRGARARSKPEIPSCLSCCISSCAIGKISCRCKSRLLEILCNCKAPQTFRRGPLGTFPRLGPATRPNRIGGFQGIYR